MARPETRSNTGWWLGLGAVALLTALAFYAVLGVRFSGGEAYPNYSTLRADPLGARALFEALGRMPGVESIRNFEAFEKLQGHPGETLMLLNVDARDFNARGTDFDGKSIAQWATSGGRVVIAFDSKQEQGYWNKMFSEASREVREERRKKRAKEKQEKEKAPADKDKNGGSDEERGKSDKVESDKDADEEDAIADLLQKQTTAAEALKISVNSREFVYNGKKGADLELAPNFPLTQEEMPEWFSNVFLNAAPGQDFKRLAEEMLRAEIQHAGGKRGIDKEKESRPPEEANIFNAGEPSKPSSWKLIAHRKDRAMIMERKMGAGSVVVCTDSFFASNEALWSKPKPQFLAWLIGDAKRVVFDETHLGFSIGDSDGLMTLARRYRMHGLFIGGILLFLLMVWRNSTSLVPADAQRDLGYWREEAVAGQSAAAGLEGLLRRGIARKKILERCLSIWESTPAATASVPEDRRAKVRSALTQMVEQGIKDPAVVYRNLRDLIHPMRK